MPLIAALLCIFFIFYVFWVDYRESDEPDLALWVPTAWLFLAASRSASQWMDISSPITYQASYYEGSSLDAVVYLFLIVAGLTILARRRINYVEQAINNPWVWLYFLFGALSVVWSDDSFISLKRWFKASGNLIMALVALTEPDPYRAIRTILRRLAFILLPLSVLFIKYYPEWGRAYAWGGRPMYTGAATHKNGLGQICLFTGVYFSWELLLILRGRREWTVRFRDLPHLALLVMFAWLFYIVDSATAQICLALAAALFLVSAVPAIAREPNWFVTAGVAAALVLGVLEGMLGISNAVLSLLDRDPTLTTRVPMWQGLLDMAVDPVFGAGYESFWLGDRLPKLIAAYGVRQAHNGYLETYLNLGMIGLALLVGCIVHGLLKARRYLDVDFPSGVARLCLIVVAVFYNWTEATFYGVSFMWTLLLLGVMDPPEPEEPDADTDWSPGGGAEEGAEGA